MQSSWRVACLRIPRFPIGAGWREERVVPGHHAAGTRATNKAALLGADSVHPSAMSTEMSASPTAPSPHTRSVAPALQAPARQAPALQLALPFLGEAASTMHARHVTTTGVPATGRSTADDDARQSPATAIRHGAPAGANSSTNASGNVHGNAHANTRESIRESVMRNTKDHPGALLHWDALPRALADGTRLRVVSLAAGRLGVRAGMSVPEARATCAALDVRPWDEAAITDATLAATSALLAASPQVTPVSGAPGMWWIGATGFGALGGEDALARTLFDIARHWHPDVRIAIADSCVAARAATWAPLPRSRAVRERDPLLVPDGFTCIPPGACAQYLAPAPLGLVPMDDSQQSTTNN